MSTATAAVRRSSRLYPATASWNRKRRCWQCRDCHTKAAWNALKPFCNTNCKGTMPCLTTPVSAGRQSTACVLPWHGDGHLYLLSGHSSSRAVAAQLKSLLCRSSDDDATPRAAARVVEGSSDSPESYVRAGDGSWFMLPGYTGYRSPMACDIVQCSAVRNNVQHAMLDAKVVMIAVHECGNLTVPLVFHGARTSVSASSHADRLSRAKPFTEVPKIPALPMIGSSWIYLPLIGRYNIRNLSEASLDMYRRYGPIVAEKLPGRTVLLHLFSADDIRTLYQEEGRTPYRVGALPFKLYHTGRPAYFANAGILNAQGEEWRRIRTMAQPCTIRPRTIQAYSEAMGRIADDAVSLINNSRDCNGDVPDCHAMMKRWSLESVMFVSLDKRLGLLEEPLRPDSETPRFMHGALSVFECLDKLVTRFPYYRYFPTPTIRKFERSGDHLVPRMFSVIKEAAEATRDKDGQNCTILSHLHNVDKVEFKEMFTFLHDFVGAGTETTAGAAAFTLYRLALHPDCQEKARQEVLSSSCKDSDSAESENHNHLPYVKACIKEALRFHPIVPGTTRKVSHDVVMSGYKIPANTLMKTEPFVAGRLEENFTRASEFLPERWLRRSEQDQGEGGNGGSSKAWTLHPFASLPFSIGPRMCIGRRIAEMELCTLVAKVLRKFRVENHHGDIGFLTEFSGKPAKPARFRFVELQK
ncbi:putative cytochrome P450 12a5, mitochondrial [Haemaphysalis longicornis]